MASVPRLEYRHFFIPTRLKMYTIFYSAIRIQYFLKFLLSEFLSDIHIPVVQHKCELQADNCWLHCPHLIALPICLRTSVLNPFLEWNCYFLNKIPTPPCSHCKKENHPMPWKLMFLFFNSFSCIFKTKVADKY